MAAGVGDAAGGGACAGGAATVQRAIDAALVLPAASVCVTRSRCSPTGSPENVTGDEHAAAAASSSEQANAGPPVAENAIAGLACEVCGAGAASIAVWGTVASTRAGSLTTSRST